MKIISKTIRFLYLFLFFTTPLIFTFFNSELFELPKMYFVYFVTVLIVTLHLINRVLGQTKLFQKHFLNLPLLIFVISQIICTFTSIDIHTSFFGYTSRLNGGLLSIISFAFLFWSLLPYLDDKFKNNLINFSLISGFLVAIYGIAQHFGIDKNIWVQDVQSRVFSTLGQPNWLAAYLCILLPFSLYKNIESFSKKNFILNTKYLILNTVLFTSLLFTKSKSGLAAVVISLTIFLALYFLKNIKKLTKAATIRVLFIFLTFIILSLTITNPIKEKLFFKQLKIENSKIENLNITPSGDIRKIVWKGSLDLFKQFPLVGTGVETFAYSYYWTRPVEHNLTSEWDFLYNKAHNEYLNYLATTGLVGTVPYLLFIFSVLFFLIKKFIENCKLRSETKSTFGGKIENLSLPVFCSFMSILITNAAGFSVVAVSLFFFLLPAFTSNNSETKIKPLKFSKTASVAIILISLSLLQNIFSTYLADILFAKSQASDSQQNYQLAFSQISQSLSLSPNNPNYLISHGTAAAKMAIITKDKSYVEPSINSTEKAVTISPANINFWKQRAQIYFYLSSIDEQYFIKTAESMLQAAKLAPTDAKIYYSLGQFLESASLFDDAIFYYQKAIDLKPNYDHAYFTLGQIYFNQKNYDLAQKNLQLNLQYAPTNSSAQKILDDIKKLKN